MQEKENNVIPKTEEKESVEVTLMKMAKRGCKHCNGTGYEGWKVKTKSFRGQKMGTYKEYMPCRCVFKYKRRLEEKIKTLNARLDQKKHKKMNFNKLCPNMITQLASKRGESYNDTSLKISMGN